jgi:hypothetical protein
VSAKQRNYKKKKESIDWVQSSLKADLPYAG